MPSLEHRLLRAYFLFLQIAPPESKTRVGPFCFGLTSRPHNFPLAQVAGFFEFAASRPATQMSCDKTSQNFFFGSSKRRSPLSLYIFIKIRRDLVLARGIHVKIRRGKAYSDVSEMPRHSRLRASLLITFIQAENCIDREGIFFFSLSSVPSQDI